MLQRQNVSTCGNLTNTEIVEENIPPIPPAFKYFYKLMMAAPSHNLQARLSDFDVPRSIDSNTFAEGVKKFIQLANSHPLDSKSKHGRQALYGDKYAGLHYKNDLATLWNWNDAHTSHEALKISQLLMLTPLNWDSARFSDKAWTLIYKGRKPAQALDELIKGPTIIDCGMFAQLSLWFGIRYMLGNKRFNHCFGLTPFFITQYIYDDIKKSKKSYAGNPLYSFLTTKDKAIIPAATVKHISNTPLFSYKHPAGYSSGENCIVIDGLYYMFQPLRKGKQGLTETGVINQLRQAFNEDRSQYDNDYLEAYALRSTEINPFFLLSYKELVELAEQLSDAKLKKEDLLNVEQDSNCELVFDMHKFTTWLQQLENKASLDTVPFKDKTSMNFSTFKKDTDQQKELMIIAKQFCQSVLNAESKLVILTGKKGVGKTTSAICAAKELAARGRKVVWISDSDNDALKIDALLANHPDVVFLDNNNLKSSSSRLIFEKTYAWYVNNPGKGLFITSNRRISFKHCYGYDLDYQYKYPPFCHYDSPQYLHQQYITNLERKNLRSYYNAEENSDGEDRFFKLLARGNMLMFKALEQKTEPSEKTLISSATLI